MLRTILFLAAALPLAVGCASSSKSTGAQVPSEMLGPTSEGAGASGTQSPEGTASAPAASAPAAPAASSDDPTAPLTADEQAVAAELGGLMKEVTQQFERTVTALEQAGGDCKKAVTAMNVAEQQSAGLEQKMNVFKDKLGKGPRPSAALMAQLRQVTLAAFPADTRGRAEVTVDALDKKCANDADFQRAKAAAAARQGG
jgi:hypothetical protein